MPEYGFWYGSGSQLEVEGGLRSVSNEESPHLGSPPHIGRAGIGIVLAGVLLLATSGCQTPSADGPADSFGLDFTMPPSVEVRGTVIFFVDGVNAQIFQEMLQKGELPALKKYFVDRGLYCPRAVDSLPAVTLPNETSVVTGLFPGHHGITGNQWFDRDSFVFHDYDTVGQKNKLDDDYTAPTLYEQFPGRTTLSLFFQAHRGATRFDENAIYAGASYVMGWFEYIDRMTLSMFQDAIDSARSTGRFPAVTVCYLLSPDFYAYHSGVDTKEYRESLRHTDRQIGRVLGDMQRAGLLDKLVLALVSDHGHTPTPWHLDLRTFLRDKAGLDLADDGLWESTPFEARQAAYGKHSAVAAVTGNRYAAIYLRKVRSPDGPVPADSGSGRGASQPQGRTEGNSPGLEPWAVRPSSEDLQSYPSSGGRLVDVPGLLVEQEAVDVVAYSAGSDRVRVRRKEGEVEFRQEGGPGADITYAVISGGDPLEWHDQLPADLRGGAKAGPRRWLAATLDTQFPNLPVGLLAYFRSRHAGDLAVFSVPGWDFFVENRSGHGGLRPADVFVPLLIAGPGVPRGTPGAVLTVDLAPTLLKLLGRPIPLGLDGVPLPEVESGRKE